MAQYILPATPSSKFWQTDGCTDLSFYEYIVQNRSYLAFSTALFEYVSVCFCQRQNKEQKSKKNL